ncbi:acetyl-CoA carboxylase biotin carboxylase subunit family protein [Rhodovulum sp. 12E13]|uniref:ATP-grasp domain-containing protein n=1 Tax=Rhodovulum sp. 12E13 TaxID=2203891 RepID=UPI001314647A|nr:ATP-grasp domain-containing protein [Rhodovulum sp. 12E13]
METVAVVGYDDFTEEYLGGRVGTREDVRFVPALTRQEVIIEDGGFPFEARLDLAERRSREAGASAVITYWDFPSSLIAPLLAERCGYPYASTTSVMRCEHKYWFRKEQAEVIGTPRFCGFDPFADDPLAEITLDFPFWIKPVVGHSSMLGFEIARREDFDAALAEIRRDIGELTKPFVYPLGRVDLPEELARRGATMCMAEELISKGEQYTIEGYVHRGEVVVYGAVASMREPNGHTFSRYQYPADLPRETVARMEEIATKIITRIGYDGCPFNMEFFLEPETGDLHVLEMNSRLSQSHSDLFHKVDGQPHEVLAVELALGRTPRWRRGAGRFDLAAKCFVRRWEDGVVRRVPGEAQLAALHEEQPETLVELKVAEGQRLSELPEQEEYSYELADLFIGARDEAELLRKKDRAEAILDFEIG